jgi:hypothetical protein
MFMKCPMLPHRGSWHMYHEMHFRNNTAFWIKLSKFVMVVIDKNLQIGNLIL